MASSSDSSCSWVSFFWSIQLACFLVLTSLGAYRRASSLNIQSCYSISINNGSQFLLQLKPMLNHQTIQIYHIMSTVKNLLVPGGLGFIGSHTVVHLLQQTDANVIIIDDLSNCFPDVMERIKTIVSKTLSEVQIERRLRFHQGSILQAAFLEGIFKMYRERGEPIDGVMHFAAKKAIGESYQQPLLYYENNVVGSINLLRAMQKYTQCRNFIFSSTAGVYGDKDNCVETDPHKPTSPYGQSKSCVEMLLNSMSKVHKNWKIISLRYFNPCGAHESYLLGDEPFVHPNNLFPYIQQVIVGKRPELSVFGNDYPTKDGTCIRDYIHITDLANGHVMALKKLSEMSSSIEVYNLGTGCGYSVLEVLKGFEKGLGQPVKYKFVERRFGDVPKLVANINKASNELGWTVTKSLQDMCVDSINFIAKRFQSKKQ